MSIDRVVHIEGHVAVHNESVDSSPRGWYEASTCYVDIEKFGADELLVHSDGLPDFLVKEELLRAALELLEED